MKYITIELLYVCQEGILLHNYYITKFNDCINMYKGIGGVPSLGYFMKFGVFKVFFQ